MRPFAAIATGLALFHGVAGFQIDGIDNVENVQNLESLVMVTYKKNAPKVEAMIEQAINAVEKMGGKITHRSNLYPGFFAKTSHPVINAIKRWGGDYVTVELDGEVEAY
ncbi:hypothetical protein BROUX41_003337 [Berkeleyomyces rouxiae]|uniref:uncharacterized protein n=1 Tax=Berkeleyomyces rouxiae TaxID=2035830 RepID=UPI003B793044